MAMIISNTNETTSARRTGLAAILAIAVCLLAATLLAGCGGSTGTAGSPAAPSGSAAPGTYTLSGEGTNAAFGGTCKVTIDNQGVAVLDYNNSSISGTLKQAGTVDGSTLFDLTNLASADGAFDEGDIEMAVLYSTKLKDGDITGEWRLSLSEGDEAETIGISIYDNGKATAAISNTSIQGWSPKESIDLTWEKTGDGTYTFYIADPDLFGDTGEKPADYPFVFTFKAA